MSYDAPSFTPPEARSQEVGKTINTIAGFINGTAKYEDGKDAFGLWKEAEERSKTFRAQYETGQVLGIQEMRRLSDWIRQDEQSPNSQMAQVVDACTALWEKVKDQGNPGHDARHVIEDLKSGLFMRKSLVDSGNPAALAYQKVSLIGSLMHDIGRLAESRTFENSEQSGEAGRIHPMLSFAITRDILDHFNIDPKIKDDLSHAIAIHQEWLRKPDAPEYKFGMNGITERSVMGADRAQLLGHEGVTRFLQFDVGLKDRAIAATMDESRKTKLDSRAKNPPLPLHSHIEYYMRTHRPISLPKIEPEGEATAENAAIQQANEKIAKYVADLEAESGVFLYLAYPHLREEIFAPELEVDARDARGEDGAKWREENKAAYAADDREKNFLDPAVWKSIKEQVDDANKEGSDLNTKMIAKLKHATEPRSKTLEELIKELVAAPNAAFSEGEMNQITAKLQAVQGEEARNGFAKAIAYILVKRDEAETLSKGILEEMAGEKVDTTKYSLKSVEHKLAQFVRSLGVKKEADSQPQQLPVTA